jgi:Ca2+-binding RTX toxin-like protein
MKHLSTTTGRALAAATTAALLLTTTTTHASAATATVKASVRKGVLTVTGTANADVVSVRLRQGDPSTLEVDLGADGTADYAFDRSLFASVTVAGSGGADRLTADSSNGVFTDTEATTLDGGDGGDTLIGTFASERLLGGAGDDLLGGGVGSDVLAGGDGADTITWEPGGGSDTVDAGAGTDRLQLQASNASEAVALSATAAGHVRLTRDIASVALDLVGVETVDLRLLGGTDSVSAGDLHGTGVTTVTTDLAGPTGDDASIDELAVPPGVVVGRDGDAAVVDGLGARFLVGNGGAGDRVHVVGTSAPGEPVTVAGTSAADTVTAGSDGSDVLVQGATPGLEVRLTATDRLAVLMGGGDDSYATLGSVSGLVALDVDGGAGADSLAGGTGPESLRGGDGDDVIRWAPGGGSDAVDGGTGDDHLSFSCANIGETVDLSAEPDGHVRLARDIGAVVLDVAGIEVANLRLLGGSDHVLVDDLTGTGLSVVDADLTDASGSADGQADEVVLFGTPSGDQVTVAADNGAVVAQGLHPTVRVSGTDPSLDRLTVYGMRGDDSVTASPDAASLIQLALFP